MAPVTSSRSTNPCRRSPCSSASSPTSPSKRASSLACNRSIAPRFRLHPPPLSL
jgi:hypothetical protein